MEVAELQDAVMASDNQESESTLIDALLGLRLSSGLELGFNTPGNHICIQQTILIIMI